MPLAPGRYLPLLNVYDMPTAVRFYTDVLGFDLLTRSPTYAVAVASPPLPSLLRRWLCFSAVGSASEIGPGFSPDTPSLQETGL